VPCSELPFVDAVMGFESYSQLSSQVDRILNNGAASTSGVALEQNVMVGTPHVPFRIESERRRITAQHTAYLRVAEGCDHTCTFCSIPGFRGKFRSKKFEAIVAEANLLAASGGQLRCVLRSGGSDAFVWLAVSAR
jgi:ribosomal protein S12 methylthiotransferase